MQSADAEDHYFFLSAPASPVHYILRSPPSSTAEADGDCCGGLRVLRGARRRGHELRRGSLRRRTHPGRRRRPLPDPPGRGGPRGSGQRRRRRGGRRACDADAPGQVGVAAPEPSGDHWSGFWPASIWPSRSKKALLLCPAPLPGHRSTSSDRTAATPAKKLPPGGSARRTTSLPYRQGLVLGCLGFKPRSYGLAKSMHSIYSR